MADEFLRGLGDLSAALKDLPGNIEKNALRTGIFRAAQFMRDQVSAAAPVSSGDPPKGKKFAAYPPGTLRDSIKAVRKSADRGQVRAGVTGAFYAGWVEFGHTLKGHRPNKETIGHVPANPFIKRAFDANSDGAVDVMKKGILDAIQSGLGKLRNKLGV